MGTLRARIAVCPVVCWALLSLGACGAPDSSAIAATAAAPGLEALTSTACALAPAFSPTTTSYVLTCRLTAATADLTPVASDGATLTLDGKPLASGQATSVDLPNLGTNTAHTLVLTANGAVKTYVVVPVRGLAAQEAYVKASNPVKDVMFGWSVAISGDTLVASAYGEGGATAGINGDQSVQTLARSGAAYVFVRKGGVWTQQAYLKASNPIHNGFFGYSVAIDGDLLAISGLDQSAAHGVDGVQLNTEVTATAAVYVFTRDGAGAWSQTAYIKPTEGSLGDGYVSVALSGTTLVVGDFLANVDGKAGAGSAHVYVLNGGKWTEQATLHASNPDADDSFGGRVAISGDTIAIGATGEASAAAGIDGNQSDNSKPNAGAVYVFDRSGTTWSQSAYIKASNPDANDLFAYVALAGDTLLVGAPQEESATKGVNGDQTDNSIASAATCCGGAGAAYVFTRRDGSWQQEAYLKASNTGDSGAGFGFTVATTGAVAVVGAYWESSGATGINGDETLASTLAQTKAYGVSGAAYVFVKGANGWEQQAFLKASDTQRSGYFGTGVAISADTVVVAGDYESGSSAGINGDQTQLNTPLSGAVYVFH